MGFLEKIENLKIFLIFVKTSTITLYERFAVIDLPIIGYKLDIYQFLVTQSL